MSNNIISIFKNKSTQTEDRVIEKTHKEEEYKKETLPKSGFISEKEVSGILN